MPLPHFSSSIPDVPPPQLVAEVDAAWERSAGFCGDDLELRVRVGHVSGRVRGELRCEDFVLERLSPSQLLALACGDPLPMPRASR